MGRRLWIGAMVVGVGLFAGVAGLSSVLPKQAMQAVMPVTMILFLAGYGLFLAYAFRGKKVTLEVDHDRLLVDEGRGGVFPLSGAALGLWRTPSVGVTAGTVLHLAGGGRALRVGGRDHRPGAALRADAPPVESVDMFLPAEAFEALLASVPFLAAAPFHAARAPLRCPLLPNPSSPRGVLAMMAPWLLTMVLVSLVSSAMGSLGAFDSAAGQMVAMPLLGAIIVAGLALTVVRSMRKSPALELEADGRGLCLRDPKTGRTLASAPFSAVVTARGLYRIHVRGSSFTYAMLALRIPGHKDVTLGVQDTRFGWSDAAPRLSAPRYIVGPPDWNALVEALGVRSFSVVRNDHAV